MTRQPTTFMWTRLSLTAWYTSPNLHIHTQQEYTHRGNVNHKAATLETMSLAVVVILSIQTMVEWEPRVTAALLIFMQQAQVLRRWCFQLTTQTFPRIKE